MCTICALYYSQSCISCLKTNSPTPLAFASAKSLIRIASSGLTPQTLTHTHTHMQRLIFALTCAKTHCSKAQINRIQTGIDTIRNFFKDQFGAQVMSGGKGVGFAVGSSEAGMEPVLLSYRAVDEWMSLFLMPTTPALTAWYEALPNASQTLPTIGLLPSADSKHREEGNRARDLGMNKHAFYHWMVYRKEQDKDKAAAAWLATVKIKPSDTPMNSPYIESHREHFKPLSSKALKLM